ncbi:MAG: FAD-linked oxidase C-terminal domain-containing protein [Myxococcota bacterium]|nr:FAD-linked oxidase C-terminal domain-containing protein [Myxococcota bacterium]
MQYNQRNRDSTYDQGRHEIRASVNFDRKKIRKASLEMALALAREIPEHRVIDDPDVLEGLAGDESHLAPVLPDIAVRVEAAEDVIATLKAAERFSVPVTPRSGGTGKAGGAIPIYGGVVLDTSRMHRILDIDRINLTALVEPGCITGVFQATVEQEGLFFPPDPNSLETCCLGGNVAHNAGGPRAFKYGVTREYVRGLDAVLMGGRMLNVGCNTVKSVAGYDLTRLLTGSEGTLGVFTMLRLALIPKPPEVATLLACFSDEIAASRAVSRIIDLGLVPRVLEFMDEVLVETIRKSGASSVPEGTGALLLAEMDGPSETIVETDVLKFADACEAEQAVEILMARHVGERKALWSARRTLTDAVKARFNHKIAEDIVVPRRRAPELLQGLRDLHLQYGVTFASYGHAGDGNYHVNVLWEDDDWHPEPAVEDVFRLVLNLGGSITGEHGIGIAKKKYLPWEKGNDQIAIQRDLKRVFDPTGLLNPGKIF